MIEFFFDCSSPWTYLAFHNLLPMAAEIDEPIAWRPILVGGVFNAVNPSVYAMRDNPVPAKMAYMLKDLKDWANTAGLTIVMPPRVFPVNSVKAMRGCIWVAQQDQARPDMQPKFIAYTRAVFESYWSRQEDISQDAALANICQQVGIDPAAFAVGVADAAVKQQLKANTDEVIQRGGFGSPTLFVGQDMYFGNDRLALVRAAVLRRRGR
jgi:2-hydroxychromene-2-carboxylate isomerase